MQYCHIAPGEYIYIYIYIKSKPFLFDVLTYVFFRNIFLMHPSTTYKNIKSLHQLQIKIVTLNCSIPLTIQFLLQFMPDITRNI